jgi:hypothetical protein
MFGGELVDLTLGNIQQLSNIGDGQSFVLLERKSGMPTVLYPRVPHATAQGNCLLLSNCSMQCFGNKCEKGLFSGLPQENQLRDVASATP